MPELNLEEALVSARGRRKKQPSRQGSCVGKSEETWDSQGAVVNFAVFRAQRAKQNLVSNETGNEAWN